MKKFALFPVLAVFLLVSCDSSRVLTSTVDDVYASPKEEKEKARQLAAEEAKRQAIARAEAEEEQKKYDQQKQAASPKEKNNSYYQDPQYSAEDYYDYEYASRINRFHNPMGLGYYDAYYTNMYTYNNNPAYYGTSIYNTWGMMPSQQFSSISFGISNSWGYGGYGMGYDPFYSSMYYPYYDPWYPYPSYSGYGSWGYMNSYNNGYWNGYRNGMYNSNMMNYYNSLDANTYSNKVNAPRSSNMGGGRRGGDNTITNPQQQRYFESVSEQGNSRPRFENTNRRVMRQPENEGTTPARNSNPGNQQEQSVPTERGTRNTGRSRNENRVERQQAPVEQTPQRRSEPVVAPANSGNNNSGGSSTRNSGSGGGSRRPH